MKEKKLNKISVCAFVFLIILSLHQVSVANETLDIPLCGGAIVPDDLPMHVAEASSVGESVVLKQASQGKIHVIDIAFIYAGSITNKGKLLQNVEAAVLRANVIFQRSGVNARLRTVAVQPDHKYNISLDGVNLSDAIDEVQSILSKVRADYGADLVYGLTTQRPGACGRASFRPNVWDRITAAQYAAVGAIWNGVNNDKCLGDTDTLVHEVGHNLGLDHNIRNAVGVAPFVSFGKGYRGKNINDKIYGTVMGIVNYRFSRFSTDSFHDGLRMGTGQANAAKALLYTIEDASNYAPTKVRDPRASYTCTENSSAVCLQSGRFKVEARVSYTNSSGERVDNARAKVRDAMLNGVNKTSSLFYFFSESNPELLVKVLNGCGVNGKYWVFGSAGTDLDHSVLVTDNATGVTLPYYRNARDPLINDTGAFPCHP